MSPFRRNRHRGADQWLHVVGTGEAVVKGTTLSLTEGALLIERDDTHEIKNIGTDSSPGVKPRRLHPRASGRPPGRSRGTSPSRSSQR